jgi:NADH-quinone oxidoreductase subunit M
MAAFFALTGLASVGFPGTVGFVGTELLVDGAVAAYPSIGVAVVVASALNGIAVVHAYFVLFTGRQHHSTFSLKSRLRERLAVLTLGGLILIGGLFPQPNIAARHEAAKQLLQERKVVADEPSNDTLDAEDENSHHGTHIRAPAEDDAAATGESIAAKPARRAH